MSGVLERSGAHGRGSQRFLLRPVISPEHNFAEVAKIANKNSTSSCRYIPRTGLTMQCDQIKFKSVLGTTELVGFLAIAAAAK
jgi:hypothetical protein